MYQESMGYVDSELVGAAELKAILSVGVVGCGHVGRLGFKAREAWI